MAVPDYPTVMLPLLHYAADRQEHSLREAVDALADEFNLTEEERTQLLASGTQELFVNRVGWARTYLVKAGLLRSTRRGYFEIAPRGVDVLADDPSRVDVKLLEQFEEFREFRALRGTRPRPGPEPPNGGEETTPEEALEAAYGQLRAGLAADILQQARSAPPSLFELHRVGGLVQERRSVERAPALHACSVRCVSYNRCALQAGRDRDLGTRV